MSFKERTALVFGEAGIEKLKHKKVAIFGLGGVGASAAMDLIRAGVGTLVLIDFDAVALSNLNRLVIGFSDTIGKNKVDAVKELGLKINPELKVESMSDFIHGNSIKDVFPENCDFYIDAIDSLNPKINLIVELIERKKPFISSMGMGNRIDPTRIKIQNIWQTSGCPLAYLVRKRLRKRGIKEDFDVIFSDESPTETAENKASNHDNLGRIRRTQGSTPFVPQTAGHFAAFYAVKFLLTSV